MEGRGGEGEVDFNDDAELLEQQCVSHVTPREREREIGFVRLDGGKKGRNIQERKKEMWW